MTTEEFQSAVQNRDSANRQARWAVTLTIGFIVGAVIGGPGGAWSGGWSFLCCGIFFGFGALAALIIAQGFQADIALHLMKHELNQPTKFVNDQRRFGD